MHTIILAAGKGTRMKSNLPKVLTPFAGKTLIQHALDTVYHAQLPGKPLVVVGHEADMVKNHLKEHKVDFIHQSEQLGTGHAVMACKAKIDRKNPVLVLYGDHALIKPETLSRLYERFQKSPSVITMMTYQVPDYSVYDGLFEKYGRILRDDDENLFAIREAKDASLDELHIHEINPAYFMFDGPWLWKNLGKLRTKNAQAEYYLTDLVELAVKQGEMVDTVRGEDLSEAIGVNTIEQLAMAEKIYADRSA